MKTSEKGIALLKAFEGLSLRAVQLKGERHYTIGYGHYGADVRAGQVITEAEAERILKEDLLTFERAVANTVKFELNQNQFDALVSFTYNLGQGNLWRLTNGRTAAQAAEHWMAYTNSGSEDYREGLTRRRKKELELFLTPYDEEELDMTKEELLNVEGTGDRPSSWAREATEWAKAQGIFNGNGLGDYGWQQPITREAVAVILHAFVQQMGL